VPLRDHDAGHGARERDDRADRQVDVAGDDDHDHADREDQDVAVLHDQVRHVDRCERDAAGRRLEEQDDHDQRDEQADLTQLARQVVGGGSKRVH
jgi:hypothetical protein